MKYPRISIVTCSFNHAWCLEETILSVINQDYPNLEYILIDGGSTDGTSEILAKYKNHFAYMVSEKDSGQAEALWKGFNVASGDVFGWLCSDDLLEPGTLRQVGEIFAEKPDWDVIYGDATFIDRQGGIKRKWKTFPFNRWIFLNTDDYIPQPSTFWRRGIYERIGGVNKTFEFMDADLFLRFSEVTKLHHFRRFWSRMRMYPEIKSISKVAEGEATLLLLEHRYLTNRSSSIRLASRAVARTLRVCWKAALGCYW